MILQSAVNSFAIQNQKHEIYSMCNILSTLKGLQYPEEGIAVGNLSTDPLSFEMTI